MNYYKITENFYEQNKKYLTKVEIYFERKLNIPKYITKDTLKTYIVKINKGCNLEKLIGYNFFDSIKMFFIYYLYLMYMLIKNLLNKDVKQVKSYDLFFEYLEKNSLDYYGSILNNDYKKCLINKTNDTIDNQYIDIINVNLSYKINHIFNLYKKIFFSFFLINKVSRETNTNFVLVILSIYKQILLIESNISNLKGKVLLSYDDNGFNSLRYFYYKKSFSNIILIQNGIRTGYTSCYEGNMYSYSDYYFSFGSKSTDAQKGMNCKNIIPIGSIRLGDIVEKYNNLDITNDIVFIEQLGPGCGFHMNSYMKCINLLIEFSKKNNFKIVYRVAAKRSVMEEAAKNCNLVKIRLDTAKKIKEMFSGTSIIIDEYDSLNSYETVAKSKVVCFYTSTLGFEALAFNKKVLNLNFDKSGHCFSLENGIGVLVNSEYKLFEEKLLSLLNENQNEEMYKEYFEKQKKYFMSLGGNPREIVKLYIAKIINGL